MSDSHDTTMNVFDSYEEGPSIKDNTSKKSKQHPLSYWQQHFGNRALWQVGGVSIKEYQQTETDLHA